LCIDGQNRVFCRNATTEELNVVINDSLVVVNWPSLKNRKLKWLTYDKPTRSLIANVVYTDCLGLDFILRLKTASYNYQADKNKRRRDGLIAQDVQEVMKELGVSFSGLIEDNDTEKTLNLSYSELVIPLINAVKEQQQQINDLKKQNKTLEERVSALEELRVEIAKMKAESSISISSRK
jgi:Chaperone of endosialidase